MQCPKCKVKMQTMKKAALAIDECSRCGGIWFDQGELNQMIGATDPDLRWLDIDFWRDNSSFSVSSGELPCPKCNRYYLTLLTDKTTNTTASVCGNCQGVWLDFNQLHRIVKTFTEIANRIDSADYLRESLKQVADIFNAASENSVSISKWRDLHAVLRMLKYRIYSEHPKLTSMLLGAQKSLPL